MVGQSRLGPLVLILAVTVVAASLIIRDGIKNLTDGLRSHSDAGTYALYEASNGTDGAKRLYRINTITGKVWGYDESVILSSDAIGATGIKKESIDAMLSQARAQGKNVYTMPYWYLLNEESDFNNALGTVNELYTIH